MPAKILFVCLGNICRSPLAEAALRRTAAARGLDVTVDSAGTGDWHIGHAPDIRAQAAALRNEIDISAYRARQVTAADFGAFDEIVALDRQNLSDLRAMMPAAARARLSLLLDHVPGREGQGVADPYHGSDADFDIAWSEVSAGAAGLVARLARRDRQPSANRATAS